MNKYQEDKQMFGENNEMGYVVGNLILWAGIGFTVGLIVGELVIWLF